VREWVDVWVHDWATGLVELPAAALQCLFGGWGSLPDSKRADPPTHRT
jgi:hypothetical protein